MIDGGEECEVIRLWPLIMTENMSGIWKLKSRQKVVDRLIVTDGNKLYSWK